MKAALIASEVEIIRTHDLDALVHRLPEQKIDRFTSLDQSWLSEWCVEARYPGDWPEANANNTRQTIKVAEGVYALVKSLVDLPL